MLADQAEYFDSIGDTSNSISRAEEQIISTMPLLRSIEDVALLTALKSLKKVNLIIFRLRVLEEMSFDEIASVTGLSRAVVKKRYSRTIQQLKQELEDGRHACI